MKKNSCDLQLIEDVLGNLEVDVDAVAYPVYNRTANGFYVRFVRSEFDKGGHMHLRIVLGCDDDNSMTYQIRRYINGPRATTKRDVSLEYEGVVVDGDTSDFESDITEAIELTLEDFYSE